MNRHLIILALLLCGISNVTAQKYFFADSSAVGRTEVATQLAIGASNRLDTYLSSEKYRGTELRFVSEVTRDSRKHLSATGSPIMTYTLTHEGEIDYLGNRSSTAHELCGSYDFSYAAMRRWVLLKDSSLIIRAGGMADLNLGFAYNTRSSANNPAQGYGSLAIGANVMAQYNFTLWRRHFRLNYEARMPFLGIMFSPNYGQSYYEIFNEGNYDHNVVFTSLATFQLRQQLSLDYALNGHTALRLGYLCDLRQSTPNNLKQHHYLNAVIIGIVIQK